MEYFRVDTARGQMPREHRHVWKNISLFVRLLVNWIGRDATWLTGLLLPLLLAICVAIVIALMSGASVGDGSGCG
jgi:hypothetical protein